MISGKKTNPRSVFLNVPFDQNYEPLFVALISAIVALGRTPRSVLEVAEQGEGRLKRIFGLIRTCPVSIHDLSRVESPARFNMPFELGIAVALSRIDRSHKFVVLEAKRHRLQMTLSDLNGIDPGVHNTTVRGVISCVLSHLGQPHGNPALEIVARIHRQLWRTVPFLKTAHGRSNVYSRSIFGELVENASTLAMSEGIIVG
jgi:hypothetical protein